MDNLGQKVTNDDLNKEFDNVVPAAKRGIDMLLAKFYNHNYQTEIEFSNSLQNNAPNLKKNIEQSVVALVTDGGLVPVDNPDNLPPTNAQCFFKYPIERDALPEHEYEVSHQGYDNHSIESNPNRLVPVDALRMMEQEGKVGKLYDSFYTTSGVMVPSEKASALGKKIAEDIKENEIDAVIITSTCGTSTRTGALISLEIEKVGIPVVQITNLVKISESFGVSRVLKGQEIDCVLGDVKMEKDEELAFRYHLLEDAINILSKKF